MEESAEAPPAAEEARRFRGSVLTAGRGSGWELGDTAVSAEEHAKKITTRIGGDLCDCPQVLLSALPHIARKGECEGGTFDGFPHSRSITRPQATDFAQQNRRSKKTTTQRVVVFFGAGDEARTRFPASHEWLSPFAGALPHLLI